MQYTRDYILAHQMFLEAPEMFLYDGFREQDLLVELIDWNFFLQDNHITAFRPVCYGVAEVHTYTRAGVDRRDALDMLLKDVEMLSLQFDTLITYVPDRFRGTINFLTKRLGFTNYGECAIRYYEGKPIKVNLLKRDLK